MKETTVQIDGMMSVFDAAGVEKQIKRRDGVERVDANFLSGTATVVYDETRVAADDVKAFVEECGYHCRGEVVPAHVCAVGKPLKDKVKAEARPGATSVMAEDHSGHGAEETARDKTELAHEMGHGMGESMDAMVRDMRRRFFVALALAVLIYLYAPMFQQLTGVTLPTPFGISKDLLGFLLATPAVLYGGWVFYVGASNGVIHVIDAVLCRRQWHPNRDARAKRTGGRCRWRSCQVFSSRRRDFFFVGSVKPVRHSNKSGRSELAPRTYATGTSHLFLSI